MNTNIQSAPQNIADDRHKRIWEFFNHNGQGHFGLAHYYLKNGDQEQALKYMDRLLEVWDEAFKIK